MPKPPLPPELDEFLTQANPAVIGTLDPDGAPPTAATWYLWENGRVLVNMDATRKRLEHLRRDPRVSLTVLDEAGWHTHASFLGRVADLTDDEALRDIDRISRHYTGHDYPDRTSPRVSGWVEIDRWHGWG